MYSGVPTGLSLAGLAGLPGLGCPQEGLQPGEEPHQHRPVLQGARVWAEVSDKVRMLSLTSSYKSQVL